jgi:hypothetical protein
MTGNPLNGYPGSSGGGPRVRPALGAPIETNASVWLLL